MVDIVVGVEVPTLCEHEALSLNDGDVFITDDDSGASGDKGVVLDVKVVLVVKLFHFVLIHLIVVMAVIIVDAG